MNSKKLFTIALSAAMLAGCGSSGSAAASSTAAAASAGASTAATAASGASGKVYYLNFKPEADEQWQEVAAEYTKETGVAVTVLTAASG